MNISFFNLKDFYEFTYALSYEGDGTHCSELAEIIQKV